MNTSVSPFSSLSAVIHALRGSVGGWGLRGWLGAALVVVLYRRLGRISREMEGLAARFVAGTLRRRVVAVTVRAAAVEGRSPPVAGERIWPARFGWLVRAASWQAAGFGSQLRAVLETPEMVALLEAAPQAARILTPLCRMLAIESSVLRPRAAGPGAAPVVPQVKVETPKRVRMPRAKVDWGRIPIPRGGLAAVRRQGGVKA
jgi:hypothetical protein